MSRYYDVCEALARTAEALDATEQEWQRLMATTMPKDDYDGATVQKLWKARAAFKTALEEYRAYLAG